jgi:nicotinate-nucleotide adenylyltransferase
MGGLIDSMFIGIFGGTFDPPHIGHMILAAEALDQLGLDRLLWVLTPDPPHKQGQAITPLPLRLEMLELALAGNPEFELSQVDIQRPPPHYAVDTVQIIHSQLPGSRLAYLIGGDSLHDLPTWHAPADFLAACDILGVMRRPGDQIDLSTLEFDLPGLTEKIRFIEAPLLEISASEIRRRVSEGRPYRYYVPAPVFEYIQENHLFQPEPDRD